MKRRLLPPLIAYVAYVVLVVAAFKVSGHLLNRTEREAVEFALSGTTFAQLKAEYGEPMYIYPSPSPPISLGGHLLEPGSPCAPDFDIAIFTLRMLPIPTFLCVKVDHTTGQVLAATIDHS